MVFYCGPLEEYEAMFNDHGGIPLRFYEPREYSCYKMTEEERLEFERSKYPLRVPLWASVADMLFYIPSGNSNRMRVVEREYEYENRNPSVPVEGATILENLDGTWFNIGVDTNGDRDG